MDGGEADAEDPGRSEKMMTLMEKPGIQSPKSQAARLSGSQGSTPVTTGETKDNRTTAHTRNKDPTETRRHR